MADQQSKPDKIQRGDTITVGDISGSVAAIGAGAQVVYNNIERALTETEVEEQAARAERERLAQSLRTYIERLHRQAQRTDVSATASPYRALLSYDFGDAALFYGRGRAIDGVLERLGRSPLTVLHADSGAGKTSLLRAGIMPRLLAAGDVPLYIRPYQTPAHYAIKRGLIVQLEQTPQLRLASLHDFLRHTSNLLGDQRLVILLDQFEELFTYQRREQRDDFIEELAPCLDDDTLPVAWLFSLRGEWFTQLGTFRPHIKSPYANEYLLQALSASEAREVITAPAGLVDVTYQDALLDTLITDLGDQAIAPPQLQLVCSALFETLKEGHTTITHQSYDDLGGTRGILRSHLDRVLSRHVPPDQRAVARQILEALVSSDRRRILRTEDDLSREIQALGTERVALSEVLPILIDSRLLRVEELEDSPDENGLAYELAHDYLIDDIELDPATQARKAAQELLEQQVEIYRRHKTLLGADELVILEAQGDSLVVDDEAQELIEASQKKLARERRIFVVGIGAVVILLGLALVSVLAAIGASFARQSAEAEQAAAERRIEASSIAIEQLFLDTGAIKLGSTPIDLAATEGAVWVAIADENQLYRIDSSNGVVMNVLDFTSELRRVYWGDESVFDGQSIWAITSATGLRDGRNAVYQIEPRRVEILQTINVGAGPIALVNTLDDVWVVTADDQTIQHIDIAAGNVVEGASLGAQPTDIIETDDLLWITTNSGELLAYDPDRNEVVERLTLNTGQHLGPMAWDGESLWVAGQPNTYYRVDPQSGSSQSFRIPSTTPDRDPTRIVSVIFDGGSVWISALREFRQRSLLLQIDPATGEALLTAYGPEEAGLSASDVEIGYGPIYAEGSTLWALDSRDGTLRRVRNRSLSFLGSMFQFMRGVDIASDGSSLWITNPELGQIQRIDPQQRDVVDTFTFGAPGQIAWDGEALWVQQYDGRFSSFPSTSNTNPNPGLGLRRISPDTGDVLVKSDVTLSVFDMVWGGDSLWISQQGGDIARLNSQGELTESYSIASPRSLSWMDGRLLGSDDGSSTLFTLDPADGSQSIYRVVGGCGSWAVLADESHVWISVDCADLLTIQSRDASQPFEPGPVLGSIDLSDPTGNCISAIQRTGGTLWLLKCTGELWSLDIRSLELIFEVSR